MVACKNQLIMKYYSKFIVSNICHIVSVIFRFHRCSKVYKALGVPLALNPSFVCKPTRRTVTRAAVGLWLLIFCSSLRRVLLDAQAGSSNLAKSLIVHDVSSTATESKFTHNLPHRGTSEKSEFFPYHMGLSSYVK